MKYTDNIKDIAALPIDMIGFIFYSKSPRCIYEIPQYMPKHIRKVGVFVNEDKDTIAMYADRFGLDYIQLHGTESPEFCRSLHLRGYNIIKAFSIEDKNDLQNTHLYAPYCKMFLFDTKSHLRGGSGKQFDWDVLQHYQGDIPFLLSGGIDSFSASQLDDFYHPAMMGIDINSRFEIEPGLKDARKIRLFIEALSQ